MNIDGLIGRAVVLPQFEPKHGKPAGTCVGAYMKLDQLMILVEVRLTEETGKIMGKYTPLPQVAGYRLEDCTFKDECDSAPVSGFGRLAP